jgi:hypothetical protein
MADVVAVVPLSLVGLVDIAVTRAVALRAGHVDDGGVTRVFRRRWQRRAVVLAVLAVGCGLFVVWAWWNPPGWRFPQLSWKGMEQAGWVVGILGGLFALASFVFDRVDSRRKGGQRPSGADGVVRVGRVPQPAAWFQDRRTRVDLAGAARAGRTAVFTQVLSGMGGVGKTQLAAQFARGLDACGELDVLVWVTASSRDAIVASYAEAADAVGVVPDAGLDVESAAGRLLVWLERTDKRWLVVLDNLDAPADAAGWWPPKNRNGRTVVTTRRRDPVLHTDGRVLVEVDLFTPAEAAVYLRHAIGASIDRRADTPGLAADLGFLPLAVAQAAAFIRDRGIDAAAYRVRFADRRLRLADLVPPDDALPDDYRTAVAATWSLSVDAADSHSPCGLARPVLNLAALLDSNGIPEALFTTPVIVEHLSHVCGRDISAEEVRDALRNLHRLSLVTHDTTTGSVRVHALVQRATRDHLDATHLTTMARTVADALLAIWPAADRDFERTPVVLRANTAALRANSGDSLLQPDGHALLFRNIRSLGEAGQVASAAAAFEQLLADCLRVLGPDHPHTLTTRHNLAHWRGEAGDPAGAAATFEQLLTDYLRMLGPDHPDTLTTRHNLARWRWEAGDPAGAAATFEQLLTDYMRVLGPDHPHTLNTRHNLAHCHPAISKQAW